MLKKVEHRNPWFFVPTLNFLYGLPLIIVLELNGTIFKTLGVSNQMIGVLSLLGLPIALNAFIAPLVDMYSTKRNWLQLTQAILTVCTFLLAGSMLFGENSVSASLVLLVVLSLACGIFAAPNGGFYIDALNKKEQGFFVGITTAALRTSIVFAKGVLVILAGRIATATGSVEQGWAVFYVIIGIILLILTIWHQFVLPYPKAHNIDTGQKANYFTVIKEFFTQKGLVLYACFIVLYRLGEGLLARMADPFLLDGINEGGLAITLENVGIMRGTMGMIAMIAGGLVAGIFFKGKHYRKWIIIFAALMTAPNVFYVLLAHYQPHVEANIDLSFIPRIFGSTGQWSLMMNMQALVSILVESFGYGMGYAAFLFVVYRISDQTKYTSTSFTIAMALQTVGWIFSGTVSGLCQQWLGYEWLFILSIVLSIPGFILLVFLIKAKDI